MAEEQLILAYRTCIRNGQFVINDAANACQLDCAAIDERVQGAVASLRMAGVGEGCTVVFCGGQSVAAFSCFWACAWLGAVFVPVDPNWPLARMAAICRRLQPDLVIVEDARLGECQQYLPGVSVRAVAALQAAAGALDSLPPARMDETAIAACLLTSGSTGEPKLVQLSRAALLRSARLVVEQFAWGHGERLLNLAEPHTMSGLRNALLAAPLAGMHWLCVPITLRDSLFALLEIVADLRPERLVAAPLLVRQLNLLGNRVSLGDLASLRGLYVTGADLHTQEVQRFHGRFGIPVINYYGLTETVGLCLSQQVSGWQPDDASLGKPVGCSIRLLGDDGLPVADGMTGELQILSPLPMSGYLDDAIATAQAFDGSWLRTGDLARCDEQGRVYLVGRSGTFINTLATEKVYPAEIEACLEGLPEVAEAAVCGLHDPAGGERIGALIVPLLDATETPPDTRMLAEAVRTALGPALVPAVFQLVERIPRSSNGKILRQQLRELFGRD